MSIKQICTTLLCLVILPVQAAEDTYTQGRISIIQPWARATLPGATAGGGFMKLENAGDNDRLVSVSTTAADAVELHTMRMEGTVMRMSKLDAGIDLPARSLIELKPGALHVMFLGLRKPFKEGERIPLRLKFEKSGEVSVEMVVASVSAAAPAKHHH